MAKAKSLEIKNWLQNEVGEVLRKSDYKGLVPMKMRWVLTIKSDNSAKARLVILGFQDHRLGKKRRRRPLPCQLGIGTSCCSCARTTD